MKFLLLFLATCFHSMALFADTGIPFFKNYTASEYNAHNRNFDVVTGPYGVVFFANFEGLLYYDNDQWHILRTPGYARVTCLLRDARGSIWVGGYNFIAKIVTGPQRNFVLRPIPCDNKLGEVTVMTERKGIVYLQNRTGASFMIRNGSLSPAHNVQPGTKPIRSARNGFIGDVPVSDINHAITLHCGWTAIATQRHGLIVLDKNMRRIYSLQETDGLCSNSVNRITEDKNGSVWGVTDNGIFRVFLPSMYTQYTPTQGLKGEVTTLLRFNKTLYIGTLQGLYAEIRGRFHAVKGINHACWKLQTSPDGKALYAASTDGVFQIHGHTARPLTYTYTQTLCCDGTDLYIAGMDNISRLTPPTGVLLQIARLSHITSLTCDRNGNIIAKDIDGKTYRKSKYGTSFQLTDAVRATRHFFSNADGHTLWATDIDGKNITCVSTRSRIQTLNERLKPLNETTVRTVYQEGDTALWIGGDFGTIRIGLQSKDAAYAQKPRLFFRRIILDTDSLLFGGIYDKKDWTPALTNRTRPILGCHTRELTFHFSTSAATALATTDYQYMLEGYDSQWSAWSPCTVKSYTNLSHGTYTFKVRARDAFGRYSGIIAYTFTIERPFYLQWYSLSTYLLILVLLIWLTVKWRLRGLIKDKERLESIIAARTMQIEQQKKEIEKKSNNLEQALTDLRHAQENLLRQEKLATMGKLTRGLIDRILNPLNYINNFSHLSHGLVTELHRSLENSKKRIERETYEDYDDILQMVSSNLTKIEQHGSNTSRILKAMEEILKEHNLAKKRIDIGSLGRQLDGLIRQYYQNDIRRMNITVSLNVPEQSIWIEGNEEQLRKILMSLISNSLYAIDRKYRKHAYAAEISLTISNDAHTVYLRLKDNGTGIDPNIIGMIFDPFFTTKTTGEATGIGLYLSREIIIDHGGDITVTSAAGAYTEFTITLPINQKQLI